MLTKETYEKEREEALQEIADKLQRIKESKDPLVLYRDVRPILDLKHMLEGSAQTFGSKPAFWVKTEKGGAYTSITYAQMFADVNGLGTSLLAGGLSGKRIAIIGENGYPWAISYLAVMCGGGVAVPLDKELPVHELQQLIISAQCSCVIFTDKFEAAFQEMKTGGETKLEVLINMDLNVSKGDVLSFGELTEAGKNLVASGDRSFLDVQIQRNEMGVLLFTSGTSGLSKGVMLSHANLAEDIMLSTRLLLVKDSDIFFSVLPLHHTYECTCGFLVPLYRGASIAYCEGLKYIVKNLQEAKPTFFLGVPALFENMYEKIWQNVRKKGKEDALKRMIALNRKTKKIGIDIGPLFLKEITAVFGGRMRMMICGGAAINPDVLQGIRDFGIMALQGYGLTESSPICALNPDTVPKNQSAGKALPETEVKIENSDPETGIGEICIRGGHIMLGYFENPEATAEVIRDGWYYTGDLGRIDSEGYIYITGRKKNVIITKNGKNVYPEELEYYLKNIPYIEETMVFGKETEDGQDMLIVAAVFADESQVSLVLGEQYSQEALERLLWNEIDKINENLPFFKRIKKLILRKEDFEKNTSKKIKRYVEGNKA